MPIRQLAATSLCVLTVACDNGSRGEPDSTSLVTFERSRIAAPAASTNQPASACPRTGRWAACSLEKRLEQSGFVPRKDSTASPPRAGFSVPPAVYTLGRARLEVFIYPDEASLRRDVANIDTTLAAPRGGKNDWEVPPRFMRSGNLAAVFLTRNEQQAERLALAITAGPPQPDP